jgi:molybdopterin-guanine dinucleotide biosynthesis protein A
MSGRRRFREVSGYVLAGGTSRRMGCDKAGLRFEGARLVDRQVQLLRAVCGRVAVIGPPERLAGAEVPVYEDEIKGQGPLGGLHAGLRRTRSEFSLFLSCDMPLMERRFLRYLCEQAIESSASATLPPPCGNGRYPLCAVLRRRALGRVQSYLSSGRKQAGRFFTSLEPRVISRAELARAGFALRIFYNVNTPEDYRKLR